MLKYLPFFCLLFLFSCSKEESEIAQPVSLQAPVITGYEYRDNNGNPLLHVGEPNIKTSVQKNGFWYSMAGYPNPANRQFSIHLSVGQPISKGKVWLVAARQNEFQPGLNFMQAEFPVTGGQPLFEIILKPGFTNSLQPDFGTLPAGGYRIYAQLDDVLLWDNILKTN